MRPDLSTQYSWFDAASTTLTAYSDLRFQVDFEVEIARLGKVCEARTAELDTLRKELQSSTVAQGALALAAHYWSERLRKTEEYSARLKSQLQLAGKVISNAHNNIGKQSN